MKTKYIALLVAIFAGINGAYAQNYFRMGFEFGAGPVNYSHKSSKRDMEQFKPITGITAGLYMDVPFGPNRNYLGMTISPKYKMTGYRVSGLTENTVFHNAALDVNLYYKIPIVGSFAVSPTAGWFMNFYIPTADELVNETMNQFNTGPSLGLTIDVVKSFQIGVEYQVGLSDYYKDRDVRAEDVKMKSRSLTCCVRFLFGG